jgi:hypothetical protein
VGRRFSRAGFSGIALGMPNRPVHPVVVVSNPRLARHGVLPLRPDQGRWWGVKTAWFAHPDYPGPFLIRGARLDGPGSVRFGEAPTTPMLAVAGSTTVGAHLYRSVPGGTYVHRPGCYGWQVDGVDFSYRILFQAIRP